jgi:hypothetical protein
MTVPIIDRVCAWSITTTWPIGVVEGARLRSAAACPTAAEEAATAGLDGMIWSSVDVAPPPLQPPSIEPAHKTQPRILRELTDIIHTPESLSERVYYTLQNEFSYVAVT